MAGDTITRPDGLVERDRVAERAMIGSPVPRREDNRLLRGRAAYLDDIDLPGCYEAAFVRSPHGAAEITSIDTSAAAELPGVVGVWTGDDLGDTNKGIPPKVTHPDLRDVARLPLPPKSVHFVGEPVAVVVAVSRYVAEDAVALVDVEYDVRAAVSSPAAALAPGAPLVHAGSEDNIAVHVVQTAGDPEGALLSAPHRLKETFTVIRGGGHSMETRAIAARHDTATGQLVVWDTTQSPHYIRNMLAYLFDVPEDDIGLSHHQTSAAGSGPRPSSTAKRRSSHGWPGPSITPSNG